MILVDWQIEQHIAAGNLDIHPYDPSCIQPNSYEMHLGNQFRVFNPQAECIDTRQLSADLMQLVDIQDYFVLHPGEFALACSVEWFAFSDSMVGQVNGISSLGRLGLQIHATAGFVDSGFRGSITLELSNVSRLPIRLYPKMRIAQMVFFQTATARWPYGSEKLRSHYMEQEGPTSSRYEGTTEKEQ